MRKFKFPLTLFAVLCVLAFSAPTASAVSIYGATPFTGQHVSAGQMFNIGTAVQVSCMSASVTNGTLVPNMLGSSSTNMARFSVSYNWCNALIAGIWASTTVSTGCGTWEVAPSIYGGSYGSAMARICARITIPSLGCVITVPSQLLWSGLSYQNVAGPNLNVVTNIPGGGMGIDWTQNGSCPGIPLNASTAWSTYAGFQGTVRANGLIVLP